MDIKGEKIRILIKIYGLSKGYPEKSHVTKFCEDFNLNYTQWTAHCNNSQKMGIKGVYDLLKCFPDLNLNWLIKEEKNVFVEKPKHEQSL